MADPAGEQLTNSKFLKLMYLQTLGRKSSRIEQEGEEDSVFCPGMLIHAGPQMKSNEGLMQPRRSARCSYVGTES